MKPSLNISQAEFKARSEQLLQHLKRKFIVGPAVPAKYLIQRKAAGRASPTKLA